MGLQVTFGIFGRGLGQPLRQYFKMSEPNMELEIYNNSLKCEELNYALSLQNRAQGFLN